MDKSYFVYKSKIKEEVKETFERINYFRNCIDTLKNIENKEYEEINNWMIKFYIEYIGEIKEEFNKKVYIYFYG